MLHSCWSVNAMPTSSRRSTDSCRDSRAASSAAAQRRCSPRIWDRANSADDSAARCPAARARHCGFVGERERVVVQAGAAEVGGELRADLDQRVAPL